MSVYEISPKNLPKYLIQIGKAFVQMKIDGVHQNLIFCMQESVQSESTRIIGDFVEEAKDKSTDQERTKLGP